jgi:3D (Asp-Asp-Asp) domain-containing protein
MKKLILTLSLVCVSVGVLKNKCTFIHQKAEILKDNNSIEFTVTATMYNASENQCDADPLITAGMYKINPHKASEHKWIAVSRDLLKRWGGKLTYGDKVRLKNAGHKSGIYKIVDTMNARFKNKIDILETKNTKLYKFENVTMIKIV